MARKRTSTSRNPKTKKLRIMPPLQAKSVRKPAKNEEKVQLDYLVVEKIASLTELKFAPDHCQELVSPTFANALRSFNSKKKLKLSISVNYPDDGEDDGDDDGDDDGEYPKILLSISGFSQQSKEEIKIDEENLNQAVQQIFTRFRRIHLKEPMFINTVGNEGFACILSDAINSVHNVTIETLDISIEYTVLIDCHRLIKKLSRNLQVLNLRIYDPTDQYKPSWKKFWQTVASCAKLVRLSVEFDYSMMAEKDGYFKTRSALLAHIADYVKLLKVSP